MEVEDRRNLFHLVAGILDRGAEDHDRVVAFVVDPEEVVLREVRQERESNSIALVDLGLGRVLGREAIREDGWRACLGHRLGMVRRRVEVGSFLLL